MEQWSIEQISSWYDQQPWLCGFNYLPRTAINWIELWQAESFNPGAIEQELGWAGEIGFNTLRTNLHSLVWLDDAAGLRDRIDRFLGIASSHGMRTMLCLFDDCGFSGREPRLGRQGDPVPGIHNSGACASPGREVVRDRTRWPELERYVKDVVGHFRDDARVLAWDIYNEPGNEMVFVPEAAPASSAPLAPDSNDLTRAAFAWTRSAGPAQPLTAAIHNPAWPEQTDLLAGHSDFLSFHNYFDLGLLTVQVETLKQFGRPLMNTEWLARGLGSVPSTHLPYFRSERIGCYHWGLVNGRTQTHLPWPQLPHLAEGGLWHHDLLHPDGRPYDEAEVALFRRHLGQA